MTSQLQLVQFDDQLDDDNSNYVSQIHKNKSHMHYITPQQSNDKQKAPQINFQYNKPLLIKFKKQIRPQSCHSIAKTLQPDHRLQIAQSEEGQSQQRGEEDQIQSQSCLAKLNQWENLFCTQGEISNKFDSQFELLSKTVEKIAQGVAEQERSNELTERKMNDFLFILKGVCALKLSFKNGSKTSQRVIHYDPRLNTICWRDSSSSQTLIPAKRKQMIEIPSIINVSTDFSLFQASQPKNKRMSETAINALQRAQQLYNCHSATLNFLQIQTKSRTLDLFFSSQDFLQTTLRAINCLVKRQKSCINTSIVNVHPLGLSEKKEQHDVILAFRRSIDEVQQQIKDSENMFKESLTDLRQQFFTTTRVMLTQKRQSQAPKCYQNQNQTQNQIMHEQNKQEMQNMHLQRELNSCKDEMELIRQKLTTCHKYCQLLFVQRADPNQETDMKQEFPLQTMPMLQNIESLLQEQVDNINLQQDNAKAQMSKQEESQIIQMQIQNQISDNVSMSRYLCCQGMDLNDQNNQSHYNTKNSQVMNNTCEILQQCHKFNNDNSIKGLLDQVASAKNEILIMQEQLKSKTTLIDCLSQKNEDLQKDLVDYQLIKSQRNENSSNYDQNQNQSKFNERKMLFMMHQLEETQKTKKVLQKYIDDMKDENMRQNEQIMQLHGEVAAKDKQIRTNMQHFAMANPDKEVAVLFQSLLEFMALLLRAMSSNQNQRGKENVDPNIQQYASNLLAQTHKQSQTANIAKDTPIETILNMFHSSISKLESGLQNQIQNINQKKTDLQKNQLLSAVEVLITKIRTDFFNSQQSSSKVDTNQQQMQKQFFVQEQQQQQQSPTHVKNNIRSSNSPSHNVVSSDKFRLLSSSYFPENISVTSQIVSDFNLDKIKRINSNLKVSQSYQNLQLFNIKGQQATTLKGAKLEKAFSKSKSNVRSGSTQFGTTTPFGTSTPPRSDSNLPEQGNQINLSQYNKFQHVKINEFGIMQADTKKSLKAHNSIKQFMEQMANLKKQYVL